jgi:DNA-binding transcriptional MerR regulator
MTIKEIAELCGIKGTHTIRNWINRDDFLKGNFTLRNRIKEKLDQGSPECPSDYNLEETLVIIGEGGGNKTLAALLAENADNKDKLVAVDNRYMGIREGIERLIDEKIQGFMQDIGQKLSEIKKLVALPAPAVDDSLQNIIKFIENHIINTGYQYDIVKQCDVWDLYKYVTQKPGKKDDFLACFSMIYSQDRELKHKNVRVFCGIRLKNATGIVDE